MEDSESELLAQGSQRRRTNKGLPKRQRSIVNVWTVLAVILFYGAYTSYSQGNTQTALLLTLVGALLAYMGLSGGTKYEL
jgi:high-affinity Fe2+/Pb2+ permease